MINDYLTIYKAIVVSVDDPTNNNLIKIRIPNIHGFSNTLNGVQDKDLPWSQFCSPTRSRTDFPKKDDIVYVSFLKGNNDDPVILGFQIRS